MAMIRCPECKKRISENADSCPSCGYQLTPEKIAEIKKKEQRDLKGFGIGCLSVVIVIVIFFIYLISSSSLDSGNQLPDENSLPQEVDGFYVGGDLMVWVGMSADDFFAIVTHDDLVRQRIEKDPNDEDSYIFTKLYRKWGKEFEIQLTVAKRGGPYSINKIVILKE